MKRTKTIRQLKKLFWAKTIKDADDLIEIPKKERKIYLDEEKITGIIPKTEQFKEIVLNNFEVMEKPVPELNYKSSMPAISHYNIKRLGKILDFLKAFTEEREIKVSVGKDYPISFETKYWIVVLAPVVE